MPLALAVSQSHGTVTANSAWLGQIPDTVVRPPSEATSRMTSLSGVGCPPAVIGGPIHPPSANGHLASRGSFGRPFGQLPRPAPDCWRNCRNCAARQDGQHVKPFRDLRQNCQDCRYVCLQPSLSSSLFQYSWRRAVRPDTPSTRRGMMGCPHKTFAPSSSVCLLRTHFMTKQTVFAVSELCCCTL
jgi:hypothetical protein